MASLNFANREILCKIVYYGPGLGGKTTNLQYIHSRVPEKYRGRLISIETKKDRTLFFDFLPLDYGKFRGFDIRLQIYTVPGQVYYNASRKIVLKGVDGIVFVADSQAGRLKDNIESLSNLRENLAANNVVYDQLPLVLQFNKRDLNPVSSMEELIQALDSGHLTYYQAVAVAGEGVFETLKGISVLVVKEIRRKYGAAFAYAPTAADLQAAGMGRPAAEAAKVGVVRPAQVARPVRVAPAQAVGEPVQPVSGELEARRPRRFPVEEPPAATRDIEEAKPRRNPLARMWSALFNWARKK
jgi:signal recognition particle receptor subunit beta